MIDAIRTTGQRARRAFGRGIAIAAVALVAAGCSPGDVEFQGKIFEVAGLTGTSQRETPKVAERAPLVVPPSLERLPAPGAAPDPTAALLAEIEDPDRKVQVSAEDLARQQAEYCSKNYDMAVARGDPNAHLIQGPAGYCRKSALSAIQGLTGQ